MLRMRILPKQAAKKQTKLNFAKSKTPFLPLAIVRILGESQEQQWFALQRGLSRGGFTLLQIANVKLV
jgi:hypothetical protein